jgi:hypothetical protein
MTALPKQKLSPEAYLEIERQAEFKSEYFEGEVYALSGGSYRHSRLKTRLASSTSRNHQMKWLIYMLLGAFGLIMGSSCSVSNHDTPGWADEDKFFRSFRSCLSESEVWERGRL